LLLFQAADGIRDRTVTGVQTCALPICHGLSRPVLAAGESVHGARHPGAVVIVAILPGNVPSRRLFTGAGYVLEPDRADGDFEVRSEERRVGEGGGCRPPPASCASDV